jgi:hypothetical protein
MSDSLCYHSEGAIAIVFVHIAEERPCGRIRIPVWPDQRSVDASGQIRGKEGSPEPRHFFWGEVIELAAAQAVFNYRLTEVLKAIAVKAEDVS